MLDLQLTWGCNNSFRRSAYHKIQIPIFPNWNQYHATGAPTEVQSNSKRVMLKTNSSYLTSSSIQKAERKDAIRSLRSPEQPPTIKNYVWMIALKLKPLELISFIHSTHHAGSSVPGFY